MNVRTKYGIALLFLALVIIMLLNFIFLKPLWWKADVQSIRNIKSRGYLTLITQTNSTGYFIYKDDTLGFEYEIVKAFAADLGVQLRVVNAVQHKNILSDLAHKKGDIAAGGFIVSNTPDAEVSFSMPYTTTEQVLVKRTTSDTYHPIGVSADTASQIVVPENYPALNSLQNMAMESGGTLQVRTIGDGICTEDLIREVSEGKIDYTIAPKEIALVNKAYYENINTEVSVTAPQEVAFCLRAKDKVFRSRFDEWLQKYVHSDAYYDLYKKYFQSLRTDMPYSADTSSSMMYISQYDLLLQKYAVPIGWDWRLLAALVWQESKFKPQARSWCGATGLMQLMPKTARRFGVMNLQAMYHPESNIKGGTSYIAYLQKYWKNVADPAQRTKFILASYNAGEGHVSDAVRLAKKYGYKTDIWDGNVEYFLLNKSKPQFYKDPVCKNGYCRGAEPFNYVRNIVKKYISYTKNALLPTDNSTQTYLAYVQPQDNFDFNFSDINVNSDYEAYTSTAVVPAFRKELFTGMKKLFQEQTPSAGNSDTDKYHNTLNLKQGYQNKGTFTPKVPDQGKKKLFNEKELFQEKHSNEDEKYFNNLKTKPRQ